MCRAWRHRDALVPRGRPVPPGPPVWRSQPRPRSRPTMMAPRSAPTGPSAIRPGPRSRWVRSGRGDGSTRDGIPSSSRSTTRAPCTGISGLSTTACWSRGRCRRASRRTRRRITSRCTPRITRWSTGSSRATSRPASTAAAGSASGITATTSWRSGPIPRSWSCCTEPGREAATCCSRPTGRPGRQADSQAGRAGQAGNLPGRKNWMIHRMESSAGGLPAAAGRHPADAGRGRVTAGRRRRLGIRDQVGRRTGHRLHRRRPGPRRGSSRPGHHRRVS